ncbi:Growth hormone-inducible transmembrane protein, partial [Fragariocoptes setiger]
FVHVTIKSQTIIIVMASMEKSVRKPRVAKTVILPVPSLVEGRPKRNTRAPNRFENEEPTSDSSLSTGAKATPVTPLKTQKRRRHRNARDSAIRNLGRWKPTDDLALLLGVLQTNDLQAVHKGIKFTCKFNIQEIEDRWYALLYYTPIQRVAMAAMRQLSASTVARIHAKTLFSDEEEAVLKTITTGMGKPPPTLTTFENLLAQHPDVFSPYRTAKILQRHWQSMRFHNLTSYEHNGRLMVYQSRRDDLPSFNEAEEAVDQEIISSTTDNNSTTIFVAKDDLIHQELMLNQRRIKRAIRRLENEIPKWQALVSSIRSTPHSDFDDSNINLAVLRGRHMRYLMILRQITFGRCTKDSTVDVDLSLEGPATKISRRQGMIEMLPTGEFVITNTDDSYTVLSTLNDSESGKLLAFATGTQASLKKFPDDIVDCHSESLLKRAFKRYLINNFQNIDRYPIKLHLFISQVPCGVFKKYQGIQATDSVGNIIKRKPGRGQVINGSNVYVQKPPCVEKIVNWIENGIQGKKLKGKYDATLESLVIGACGFPDESSVTDEIKKYIPTNICPKILYCPEFIHKDLQRFRNNGIERKPLPINYVWWSRITNNMPEKITDGRPTGLTKRAIESGKIKYLQVGDIRLREDIETLLRDQINLLACHGVGLGLSIPYRLTPTKWRNEFNYLPGLLMVYYCFRDQANSFVIYSLLSYVTIRFSPAQIVHRTTLCLSLGFLSYAHLSRQIMDYGGYVIDISGPFMIAVQKMTSLGFCIHDGVARNPQDLTEEQRALAVKQPPSLREFLGYFFQFSSILCGPIVYFNDYIDAVYRPEIRPGAYKASMNKLKISSTSAILLLVLGPKFNVNFLRSAEFLHSTPLIMRFCYITIFTMLSRLKYYVAWHLGESVSNSIGFGYGGIDKETNQPKWDKCSSMDLIKFETSLNLRDAILAWNKSTQTWLRRTAYERAPRFRLLATYVLSAVWHGFYPGYYMTFLGGALFTQASRLGRRHVRPVFQRGKVLPKLYDFSTFVLTRITIAYIAFPFVILDFKNNIAIYRSLYFLLHIMAATLILFSALKGLTYLCQKIFKIPKGDITTVLNPHQFWTHHAVDTSKSDLHVQLHMQEFCSSNGIQDPSFSRMPIREFSKSSKLGARVQAREKASGPLKATPVREFNPATMNQIGMMALAGAGVLGIGALCYYGIGLSSAEGAYERSFVWPQYVKDRIRSTYSYLGLGFALSGGAAYATFRSPAAMRLMSSNPIAVGIGSFVALIASSYLVQSMPYDSAIGPKHAAWVAHCALLGFILAPMSIVGGPVLIRAASYTAGIIGGLSAIAVCAPSEKFLAQSGPLGIGLGVVVASSLGSMFLPPTSRIGLGLYGIALYGGLIVFSGMLLYDTQKTIKRAEMHPMYAMQPYDPINNSLHMYMDIINIFVRMVQIMAMGGNGRKR